MIEVKYLVDIVLVVLIIKLIVSQWQPPVQKSLQGMLCVTIGTIISLVMYPTVDGFFAGVIGSGFAFYGGELGSAFKGIQDELEDFENIKK